MIFLDFEASGMYGFPIEVGFCAVGADRSMRAEARMIRHDPWLDQVERWDTAAQDIHHIDRAALMALGQSPAVVMTWLNAELAGLVAVADSPCDKLWLAQLAEAAGVAPTFGLVDDMLPALRGPEISGAHGPVVAWRHISRLFEKAHRADIDAEQLARWYLFMVSAGAQVHRLYRTAAGGYERRPLI